MARPNYSDQAKQDLEGIFLHIASDDTVAAENTVRSIMSACDLIADMPGMGRMRPEFSAVMQSFPCGNYVVFYKKHDDTIVVFRIIHASRDIDAITLV